MARLEGLSPKCLTPFPSPLFIPISVATSGGRLHPRGLLVLRGEDYSDPRGNSTVYVERIKGAIFAKAMKCMGHGIVIFDEVGVPLCVSGFVCVDWCVLCLCVFVSMHSPHHRICQCVYPLTLTPPVLPNDVAQIQKVVPGTLEALAEAMSEHPTISHYAPDGTLQHIDTSRYPAFSRYILRGDFALWGWEMYGESRVQATGQGSPLNTGLALVCVCL